MHYATRISYWMQKHKFDITCPDALFTETTLGPPEHEKSFIDDSRCRRTVMLYMTHISHRMFRGLDAPARTM
jgi:hypothetical protein